ncbi:unannotated protein [freshwater metagenome]|uniref:Unannotated protein n=1 Tax=freshwater metagenome TaxID=449393 RepID=A0A6J7P726_9ZZZZ
MNLEDYAPRPIAIEVQDHSGIDAASGEQNARRKQQKY